MPYLILADDSDIFRAGAARLLMAEEDLRIVMQCKETIRLNRAVDSYPNAIVVVASKLLANSPGLLARIQLNNGRSIVVAEMGEDAKTFLDQGAHGLLYRSASGAMLLDCIRQVCRGEHYVQAADVGASPSDPVGTRVRDGLTPKELKVLSLIMQGCKNREVGLKLKTSEQVIKNYLRGIFDKVGVSDRLELALFTIHHPTLAAAVASVEVA
ncbi:response regulator transcription factor [Alloacidobacterium dinghuense]|uniref:Response regulator transcription factor n=1 Tax=Alloacidobacterium dinghuense TaxID=2763107 RepID=A0A7G8BDH5_9BACT|nr:response regulator transcription factor [Alloacidobacterium dinghuense]QNI30595.1 response regulator transcription factor [Alloacidobacterium dinghuense]